MNLMRLTVIGIGYLGLTHAACMAELGHDVTGVDTDPNKIKALAEGRMPFYEPGLDEVLERAKQSGRFHFTDSYEKAAKSANVHFLAVGTPQKRNSHAADLTQVKAVINSLVPHLKGHHVIFGKSTVPVGTAKKLQKLADKLAGEGTSVEIAWNPEFLREGHAVEDTLTPDRIVLGITDKRTSTAESIARDVYATPLKNGTPFIVTDLATAELVKVSANAFLATKISFINAVAEVCERAGADVVQLADAIGYDDRIGRKFLGAGLGFGGGCLPKDIRAFVARAGELGANEALLFLREVDNINLRRRERMVQLVKNACGGTLAHKRVTILGCAFKPESDDVRDSPALAVAGALSLMGADVTVYDPQAMVNAEKLYPTLTYAHDLEEALTGADAVGVATEWKQFQELDPHVAGKWVGKKIIIDGRNCLPVDAWEEAGWNYKALGRG